MEELTLTDPVVVPETVSSSYKVTSLILNFGTAYVHIELVDNLGVLLMHDYTGQVALDMMKWMNTANFSVNSMHKRILQKLTNDGVLVGTVTGTPDPPPPEL